MALPTVPFHMINAFGPSPYAGNQASVVLFPKGDPRTTDDGYMQKVARDFNLSETAFVHPLDDSDVPKYSLRWFTPTDEVPLCGHATLAAAATLFNYVHPQASELHFETRWRGPLVAYRESEAGQGVRVGLSLPISEIKEETRPEVLAAVLGAAGLAESDVVQLSSFDFGGPSPIVQLRPDIDLASLAVDESKLLPNVPATCVYTQAVPDPSQPQGSFKATCRVFAPGLGVPEDPVTGSAWAILTGFYLAGSGRDSAAALLTGDVGAATIDAHQLSSRGGALTCTMRRGRAYITGRGWRTAHGTLENPLE
ncbi:hypothetical protein CspeluHIS016_0803440 [Cutaneotrichosporon spelunceum]|uniref:Diaminopimelate epimerase-like protein n=1 Tax=Cutaneotrichosporon spelunceum TaxID=1672016 RepID=A0AAD3YF25_9TREE|nr:hypothetical protein CspeluHIS016_0803440 [Cutaneotrichosporon spelunceum]